jgi:inner membrane protein
VPAPSLSARIPALDQTPPEDLVQFDVSLALHGATSLMLMPLAGAATVSMKSLWPSPSFGGSRLPDRHRVGGEGFTAEWQTSAFGRNVPRTWTDGELPPAAAQERIEKQAFGVTLATPVDVYQQAERSTKYGVLFIALTFLTFFLVETLYGATVHPVQYLMIGAALCLFYLLLLALSEHIGFTPAYLLAAGSTIALIGGYARAALGARRSALAITIMLVALYGCLYVLLQLEDYALMMGSIFLFAVLAAVMFVTRRVNWYEVASTRPATRTPGA